MPIASFFIVGNPGGTISVYDGGGGPSWAISGGQAGRFHELSEKNLTAMDREGKRNLVHWSIDFQVPHTLKDSRFSDSKKAPDSQSGAFSTIYLPRQ
jgi:hypothetical protein